MTGIGPDFVKTHTDFQDRPVGYMGARSVSLRELCRRFVEREAAAFPKYALGKL
jgi:hypothetical protein